MSPPAKKPTLELPMNVTRIKARGRYYYYHQIGRGSPAAGPRTRINAEPHEPEFWKITAGLNGEPAPAPAAGTFDALIAAYKNSPDYLELRPSTQKLYSYHLAAIQRTWGKLRANGVTPGHILNWRDALGDTPSKANCRVAVLSALYRYGVPRDFAATNPATGIRKLKGGDGYSPWEWSDIDHLQSVAPPHIWRPAAGAIYTGQRQSDVLAMKWSDIRDGLIHVTQDKGGQRLWVPLHRDFLKILENIPRDSIYIFVNSKSIPWATGFKASWRKFMARPEMQEQKNRRLVYHGFRKTAVITLLEAGCTDEETASISGQSRQMIVHYSREINQRKMARSAMNKWEDSGR